MNNKEEGPQVVIIWKEFCVLSHRRPGLGTGKTFSVHFIPNSKIFSIFVWYVRNYATWLLFLGFCLLVELKIYVIYLDTLLDESCTRYGNCCLSTPLCKTGHLLHMGWKFKLVISINGMFCNFFKARKSPAFIFLCRKFHRSGGTLLPLNVYV